MRDIPTWLAALIIGVVLLLAGSLFLWRVRQSVTPQVPPEVLEKFRQGSRPQIPGMGPAAVPRPSPPPEKR
ncbi:MAG: hypothetical protein LKKZDAJK_001248 [Candidatus Fervidibacter sp.]